MQDVRPSPIAGAWYPGDPEKLRASVDAQLEAAQIPTLEGEIVGVIAPHAGHRYSGAVAAHAFRSLQGLEPAVVAVISPMHQPFEGRLCTTDHRAYATPLGEIPVDHALIKELEDNLDPRFGLTIERIRFDQEHSLEIELPFLQRVLHTSFRLLPLMLRDQTRATCEAVGHALAAVLRSKAHILVASSDLSHFKSDAVARKLDAFMLERVEAFDPVGILDAEEHMLGYACGKGAMAAVLWAAKDLGATDVKVLNYANSGDVTGDLYSVVGYGAAVITRSDEPHR
jgi:AmmeMemoRadiSam system protein B